MDDESWIKISDTSYRHYSQPLYTYKIQDYWTIQSCYKTPIDNYGPFGSLIDAIIFGNSYIKAKAVL